jgi:hypothetical protein
MSRNVWDQKYAGAKDTTIHICGRDGRLNEERRHKVDLKLSSQITSTFGHHNFRISR